MVARYFGLGRGQSGTADYVFEGAATTGKSLEVVINPVATWTQSELKVALDRIFRHIITSKDNLAG